MTMTPTQREAAARLAEFERLPRKLLDIACRVRVNECLFHDDEFVDDASHTLKEALALLRELLAEPVINHKMTTEPAEPHYTITWDAQGRRLVNGELAPEHRTAKPAQQPQGEPVAWRSKTRINNDFDSNWCLTSTEPPQTPRTIAIEPLYIHPPQQRKPLTDRQAIALWADRSDGPANHEIISFARAIEEAHGIEEAP